MFVEADDFTAGAVSGVDGEDSFATQRCAHQQLLHVVGEGGDGHRVGGVACFGRYFVFNGRP